MDSKWNMKGAKGLWKDNFEPYGLKRKFRWNMNGMQDFGETILDSMNLE
jgi:GH43 family beta-xylosidase